MNLRPTRPRRRGRPPFRTVLVHGGPGAPGSLAAVARELSDTFGVLEPWQTARTVAGQVEELTGQVEHWADPPVTLVGHSWGAWLSVLVAGQHPEQVRRVVLVGSAPFRTRYLDELRQRRRQHLTKGQWDELERLGRRMSDPGKRANRWALHRLGELAGIADSYSLIPEFRSEVLVDPVTFRAVWPEAETMRRSGSLARALRRVRAPVTVLHGKDDPHPVRGVVKPLRDAGLRVRVVLLDRCGHEPWRERYGRRPFFEALRSELALS